MRHTLLYLPIGLTELLLILLAINLVLSAAVAIFIGSKRVIGFWGSFLIGFIASAIIGLLITLFYKTKNQEQTENALANKFAGSDFIMYEIQHLKVLRQSGIISKTEYENEIDRLLNL